MQTDEEAKGTAEFRLLRTWHHCFTGGSYFFKPFRAMRQARQWILGPTFPVECNSNAEWKRMAQDEREFFNIDADLGLLALAI